LIRALLIREGIGGEGREERRGIRCRDGEEVE